MPYAFRCVTNLSTRPVRAAAQPALEAGARAPRVVPVLTTTSLSMGPAGRQAWRSKQFYYPSSEISSVDAFALHTSPRCSAQLFLHAGYLYTCSEP